MRSIWKSARNSRSAATGDIADVRDADRIGGVFEEERPELVFHAAAETRPDGRAHPDEGALTNVIGTKVVADACCAHHPGNGPDIDRQGGQPVEHDGRDQARRRATARRWTFAKARVVTIVPTSSRSVRQRARVNWVRSASVPAATGGGRTADDCPT